MKKLILATLLLSAATLCVRAQLPQLPTDPDVRVGKLDNGLTYYIRANSRPEKQAEFYILHNVGAIQEEDSQQGLAHFLEHMAFNGTKNFPGKQLINYLESVGVKFGANLNAYTSMEHTCYNMSAVPTTRQGIIDSALLVLHDWSYFITLDDKEIDDERGVIIEELRTRNSADWRIREKQAPAIYNGSKYAERNIIGTIEGLRSFSPQELKDFYHRWYRTDLQTIVIVGDFDPDRMEADVRRVMADIPAVENPEPKAVIEIPDNEEPIIAITTDPEQTVSQASLIIRREAMPAELNNTPLRSSIDLILAMARTMTANRLQEITQKPDAPFISALFASVPLTTTSDAMYGIAISRDDVLASFEALLTEVEKIRRFGFTESELDVVKKQFMRDAERAYAGRNDRRHNEFVDTYLSNYRLNTPMMTAEDEWQLDSTLIATITTNEINGMMKAFITPENTTVTFALPEKEGDKTPTEEQVLAIIDRVRSAELSAYEDSTVAEELIPAGTALKGSPVRKTEKDIYGATVWTLRNGATVAVLPTDFKQEEVIVNISSRGGTSTISDADYPTASTLDDIMLVSGFGTFSRLDLRKQLAGKAVNFTPTVGEYKAGFGANCSPRDLETLMQLIYLGFTSPRFDRDDFQALMSKYEALMTNLADDPGFIFEDSLASTLYPGNLREKLMKAEDIALIDFDRLPAVHEALYGGAQNALFTIVGNVSLDEVKPLVEKYIGSIPKTKGRRDWKDLGTRMPKGLKENRFEATMAMPKTTVLYIFSGDIPYTNDNRLTISALSQIMRTRYTETIREGKGGSYGVSCTAGIENKPTESYTLNVKFDTNREQSDELMEIVTEELGKLAATGPSDEEVNKIKEYMRKQYKESQKRNSYWLNHINSLHLNGFDGYTGYAELIEALSPDKIKALAAKIVADGNVVKVVMDPKE